jgi:uncharacterized membrane protein YeaQ/YmgE (transglycosylase-associated protein family)
MSKEAMMRGAILSGLIEREVGMSPMQQNFIKLMTALVGVMVFLIALSMVLGA